MFKTKVNFIKLFIILVFPQILSYIILLGTNALILASNYPLSMTKYFPINIFNTFGIVAYFLGGISLYMVWQNDKKKKLVNITVALFSFLALLDLLWFSSLMINVSLILVSLIVLLFFFEILMIAVNRISKTAILFLLPLLLSKIILLFYIVELMTVNVNLNIESIF
jgi:tryptophan-rich sensory protein